MIRAAASRILRALGIGGVPAGGYFGAGWGLGTVLVLYWVETVLVAVMVAILLTRWRRTAPEGATIPGLRRSMFGGDHALAFVAWFLVGHGLFVAVLVFQAFPQIYGPQVRVSLREVGLGAVAIALLLLASLVLDLVQLGRRPGDWVGRTARRAEIRILVTHLTILVGATALAATDSPLGFLAVFVAIKSIADLWIILREPSPGH